jgi:hypothetical protein
MDVNSALIAMKFGLRLREDAPNFGVEFGQRGQLAGLTQMQAGS